MPMNVTGIDALKVAVTTIGTQTDLARVVGRTPQAVSDVLRRGLRVPPEWCIPIEDATEGKITRSMLRPDLYPIEQARA